jgi:hypothetical protein
MDKESEILITPTHSVEESHGAALWLKGNQSMYLIAGVFFSVIIAVVGNFLHWSSIDVLIAFPVPIIISIIYLLIFHIGKPPGYQEDALCLFIEGANEDFTSADKLHKYIQLKVSRNENEST